jgi:hypothetical protein
VLHIVPGFLRVLALLLGLVAMYALMGLILFPISTTEGKKRGSHAPSYWTDGRTESELFGRVQGRCTSLPFKMRCGAC